MFKYTKISYLSEAYEILTREWMSSKRILVAILARKRHYHIQHNNNNNNNNFTKNNTPSISISTQTNNFHKFSLHSFMHPSHIIYCECIGWKFYNCAHTQKFFPGPQFRSCMYSSISDQRNWRKVCCVSRWTYFILKLSFCTNNSL